MTTFPRAWPASRYRRASANVAQRVASVDNRHHFPCFEKLLQEKQIVLAHSRHDEAHLVAGHGVPRSDEQDLEQASDRTADQDVNSFRTQCAPVVSNRTICRRIQDQVITLSVPGEILPRVVDDVVRTDGSHQSRFLVLHTAVTSVPNALAICTAKVPTPPDAPLIRTF